MLKQIDEWKYCNLTIDIGSMYHADINLRSPKDKGYINYFYDSVSKMYVTYEITITKSLNKLERKQHGKNAKGILIIFELPLNMFITVIRSDIQKRNKNKI